MKGNNCVWIAVLWLAVLLAFTALAGGCAGLGLSGAEVELIDGSAADARFVDRHWESLAEGERREFVRENALRWGYFSNLVHGRGSVSAEAAGERSGR